MPHRPLDHLKNKYFRTLPPRPSNSRKIIILGIFPSTSTPLLKIKEIGHWPLDHRIPKKIISISAGLGRLLQPAPAPNIDILKNDSNANWCFFFPGRFQLSALTGKGKQSKNIKQIKKLKKPKAREH